MPLIFAWWMLRQVSSSSKVVAPPRGLVWANVAKTVAPPGKTEGVRVWRWQLNDRRRRLSEDMLQNRPIPYGRTNPPSEREQRKPLGEFLQRPGWWWQRWTWHSFPFWGFRGCFWGRLCRFEFLIVRVGGQLKLGWFMDVEGCSPKTGGLLPLSIA